jgi:hypothetical protein
MATSTRCQRMHHVCPPESPLRPYPWRVTTDPEKPQPHRVLPDAAQALIALDETRPVMVTTWAVVCEYIDETGAAGVAAWASDDPQWRINGLLAVAADMLDVDEFDDEEIDDE